MVNKRSIVTEPPVYLSVPPLITKFAASLVDCPMPLAVPPLANEDAERVPALIVVAPV